MKKRNQLIKREIRKQFRKLYWKLAFVKLHNENRRKRVDDEILKRIEVLEQKAHIKRSAMKFEFDLPKNEAPFVEVQEGELVSGKEYLIAYGGSVHIAIFSRHYMNKLLFKDKTTDEEDYILDIEASKFYQYCPTK